LPRSNDTQDFLVFTLYCQALVSRQ